VQGFPTIGYGWNCSASPITESEASLVLGNRMIKAISDATSLVADFDALSDARQHVLADMCFNMGKMGLSNFKRMLKAVEEGRYDDAADEMKASAWFTQVGIRAPKLEHLMRTGHFL
jgi:lysozyme